MYVMYETSIYQFLQKKRKEWEDVYLMTNYDHAALIISLSNKKKIEPQIQK